MTSQKADPLLSLDARYYTDAAIYHAELQGLLAKTWQFAGHASNLERPGDYFTFEIAGESLFCILDEDRELRCFYNVCQHRAHQLLQGSGNNRLIVCPYHAWNYQLDGKLRSGPNIKVVPGFNKESICLTSIRVEWIEVAEQCNWKVSVENYSECYHCKLNHRTFATGVVKPETYDIQPQGYCLRHTTECQNLDKMSYPIDLDANAHAGDYSSVDTVVLWRGWYTIDGEPSETIKLLAAQDRETTVAEDITLVESVHRGLQSRGYKPGPLVLDPNSGVDSEHSIATLQAWMRNTDGNGY